MIIDFDYLFGFVIYYYLEFVLNNFEIHHYIYYYLEFVLNNFEIHHYIENKEFDKVEYYLYIHFEFHYLDYY